jgi:N-acetylglucosamine-6-phosphate deacetylase
MDRAVFNFVRIGRVSLADAILAATRNPARLLQLPAFRGEIVAGAPANLIRFQLEKSGLRVKEVLANGCFVA